MTIMIGRSEECSRYKELFKLGGILWSILGASIANLTSLTTENGIDSAGPGQGAIDKAILVRASRQLLSSVTRVLLLADRVLVKHILRAEDKVTFPILIARYGIN